MPTLALLIPKSPGAAPAPETLPIGRAALSLKADGIDVVFTEQATEGIVHGVVAIPGGWQPVQTRVKAAIDRFPSFTRPAAYAQLLAGLGGTPVHNPPSITALLRDKVRTQAALGGMPAMQTDARRFAEFLSLGPAFLKPRFGSFGRGIVHCQPGETPAARAQVDGVDQPMFLQRAVPPLAGFAGIALRILVHRTPRGFKAYPAIARVSAQDPIVNRARGAEVMLAREVDASLEAKAHAVALRVAHALPGVLEIGVDAVVDPEGRPHLIEVNARPRGRLAALAQDQPEFEAAHREATRQPFLTLADD